MYYYQVYWDDGYEAVGGGEVLRHEMSYSEKEFQTLVAIAINKTRGYPSEIADYLVIYNGFTKLNTIDANTCNI